MSDTCPVCGGPCVQKQGRYADEFSYESTAEAREQRLQEALREGLAAMYPTYPLAVAELCDMWLDRSGKLLGEIRAAADPQEA